MGDGSADREIVSFDTLADSSEKRTDFRLIADFESYRYRRHAPWYSNLADFDGFYGARMRKTFAEREAIVPRRRIARFSNATTLGAGVVLLSDGQVVRESLQNNKSFNAHAVPASMAEIPVEKGCFALLRKAGDGNYGHWLIELTVKALEFQRACLPPDTMYLVAQNPISLIPLRTQTLRVCGVDESRIKWIGNEPHRFESLFVCSPNSIHSHTHSKLEVLEFRSRVLSFVNVGSCAGDEGCKLFLGRTEGRKRRALNEDEAFDLCREHGYTRVYPEEFSFIDQVKMFARATHIVGVFGASLTNMMWSEPGCRVCALTPTISEDYFFWDLASIVGHRYSAIFGASLDPNLKNVHQDFMISLPDLEKYLLLD